MAFVLNTPTQDVVGSASDAGGSAIAPSVLLNQLNAAQVTIAELHGVLGAVRTKLKAVVDAHRAAQDTSIKLVVLQAKVEMQAILGALQAERQSLWARIKQLEEQQDPWISQDEQAAASRDASEALPAGEDNETTSTTPGAAAARDAPGLSTPPGVGSAHEAPGLS